MTPTKENSFRRNVGAVSAVEFFWGLGFPLVLESTFLQLFLKKLGASSFAIGVVPSLFIFGISTFPIFATYLSRNFQYRKVLVTLLHAVSGMAVMLFGSILLLLHEQSQVIPLFFGCYTVFSLGMGLTIPIWLDFIVRIFPPSRTVPALGYMMLAQNFAKVISSFFILAIVDRYAFSIRSSAYVFLFTGAVFIIGSLCFLLTKEVVNPKRSERNELGFIAHTRKTFGLILSNRRFLVFLIADLDIYVVLTVMSFYATYATGFFGIDPAIGAGAFVGAIYGGSIGVNILFGVLNLLELKQKLILSKCISLTILILLIFLPNLYSFFVVSFMLGIVRAMRNMIYAPSIKLFAGRTDATAYFSLAPILTLPIGSGLPLLFGKALDLLSPMQADSFRILFGLCFLYIVVTLYFSIQTDYSRTADDGRALRETTL